MLGPVPSPLRASVPTCTVGPLTPLVPPPTPGHAEAKLLLAAATDAGLAWARVKPTSRCSARSWSPPSTAQPRLRSSLCSVPMSASQGPTALNKNKDNGNRHRNCQLERWKGQGPEAAARGSSDPWFRLSTAR